MDWGGSPAVRALRQAQAVAAYARRTGCGTGEAAEALAEPAGHGGPFAPSRRTVLGGAAAAALAAAVPAWASGPAWAAGRARAAGRDPRVVIIGSGIAGLGCA